MVSYPENVEYVDFGFEGSETDYPLNRDEYRASLIGAFQMAFNESPYSENFDFETMQSFLDETEEKDYLGRIALVDNNVVGFAWGYRIESGMSSDFPDEIFGPETELSEGDSYYFEELGVLPDYRGQGIGKELKRQELQQVKQREDVSEGFMRTQYNGERLEGLELPDGYETGENGNERKLGLDVDLGFEPVEVQGGPVIEEVNLEGTEGSDERIYMSREV